MGGPSTLILSICAGLLLVHSAHAETTSASGAEEITTLPATITQPGTYYLSQNLQVNIAGGYHVPALLINASDVTIDLNGHTITNLGAGPDGWSRGITAYDRHNITIKNGTLIGFHFGIILESNPLDDRSKSSGHLIENIYATNCNFVGVAVCGGDSIVRRCRFNKIGGNSVRNDFWPTAVVVFGNNHRVLDCDIGAGISNTFGEGTVGILCASTVDTILEGNRVTGVTHAIAYRAGMSALFKYRDTLTGFGISIPYWVGPGAVDAGGNN
jgi:hypothetical protein